MFAFLRVLLLCVHLLHFKIISGADIPSHIQLGVAGAPVWEEEHQGEIKPAPGAGLGSGNITAEEVIGEAARGE